MLTAYYPLKSVYAFHVVESTWLLRRYADVVTVDTDGEPRALAFAEGFVKVFRDPQSSVTTADLRGSGSVDTCTVYTLTALRGSDEGNPAAPVYHDVLFDVLGVTGAIGSAWPVQRVKGWPSSLGYETVLVRQGQRGLPPWV